MDIALRRLLQGRSAKSMVLTGLKRGLGYAPRWGQIGFTVPMFDGFMRRGMPSAGA